ncbi:hypothetical protein C6P45_004934 [Maudiozyma exigua]|uniref:UNC-45/Cro1/She4 central domain-containing protein n=1 Tax=Maudiozyma exigua TaxID=34358 RepID=A0A9P6W9K1_MAUEX|nr:hypothetical protein C6P45_004934 [Kazachstania exigua]
MEDPLNIDELCKKFDKDLKAVIPAQDYNSAVDRLFLDAKAKKPVSEEDQAKIEQIIQRAYQDHSETRDYLKNKIREDNETTLDLFKNLSGYTFKSVLGTYEERKDIEPLFKLIQSRLENTPKENTDLIFYITAIPLVLEYKQFEFKEVEPLFKSLCLLIAKDHDITYRALSTLVSISTTFSTEFPDAFYKTLEQLVVEAEISGDRDLILQILIILSTLYTTFASTCSFIPLSEKFSKLIIERVSKVDDEEFVITVLELLSIACVDETVRVFITENFLPLLERSMSNEKFQLYSSLVLIKTWSFTKLKTVEIGDLTQTLLEVFLDDSQGPNKKLDMAIEGLAYLSLRTTVKMILRHSDGFISNTLKIVTKGFHKENIYGVLIMLANVTSQIRDNNKVNKSIKDMSEYAEMRHPTIGKDPKEEVHDDPVAISKFNTKLLNETEVLSNINSRSDNYSPGTCKQLVRIIYNLTREKENLPKIVEQGSGPVLVRFLESSKPKNVQKSDIDLDTDYIRLLAIRSLTKILVYTNPNIIFNRYSCVSTVPFLFELLPVVDTTDLGSDNNIFMRENEHITAIDQVEALLSLTNIASISGSEGEEICKTIVTQDKYWSAIENLILDSNEVIQRSSLELISNLMSYPIYLASKIFNFENPQSLRNFNILVKLLMLDDIKSQRAVVAIFANISCSIPFIASELLKKDEFIQNSMKLFITQMDDIPLRQRLLMLFYSIFDIAPSQGEEGYKDFARILEFPQVDEFKGALKKAMSQSDTGDEFSEVIPSILAKF